MTKRTELVRLVLAACKDKEGKKRLDCAAAFALAKEHEVTLSDIGAICDDQGIKIVKCQLGCF